MNSLNIFQKVIHMFKYNEDSMTMDILIFEFNFQKG